jgi:hypothetical protein
VAQRLLAPHATSSRRRPTAPTEAELTRACAQARWCCEQLEDRWYAVEETVQAARVGGPAVGAAQAEAERLFLALQQAETRLAALQAELTTRARRRAALHLTPSPPSRG